MNRTVVVLLAAITIGLTACAPTTPPLTEDEQAQLMCEATEYGIAKHFQPDAADAWSKRTPAMCEDIRERLGRTDFIDLYLNEDTRNGYIEYRMANG